MTSLTILLCFAGFYLIYFAAGRIGAERESPLERWIYNHKAVAKTFGIVLLLHSLTAAICVYGVGAGTLLYAILLTTVASLVIVAAPLKIFSYKWVSLLLLCSIIIEKLFV